MGYVSQNSSWMMSAKLGCTKDSHWIYRVSALKLLIRPQGWGTRWTVSRVSVCQEASTPCATDNLHTLSCGRWTHQSVPTSTVRSRIWKWGSATDYRRLSIAHPFQNSRCAQKIEAKVKLIYLNTCFRSSIPRARLSSWTSLTFLGYSLHSSVADIELISLLQVASRV